MTDYYELLEVTDTASVEVIRAAYKAGVKKYHPDNFTDTKDKARATEQLKLLNEALETLTDPERRARYDEELKEEKYFFGKGTDSKNTQDTQRTQRQTKTGYEGGNGHTETGNGHDENSNDNHDLTTCVEALIVRCKNEAEYLELHDTILRNSAPEADKIQMLHILDDFTKVRLQQELNDESKLEDYRGELKSVRLSIVFYLVIGFFLTNKFDWAFLAAIILSIIVYCGAKDDRENFARAERAAHLVEIYRMHGFKI